MAASGTPLAYGACTVIVAIRVWRVPEDRRVWGCFAVAGLLWTLANAYYAFFVAPEPAPLPSLQDVGYMLFPVALMLGLAEMVRARGLRFSADLCLDGLVAGLGVAAAATAMVFTLANVTDDDLPSVITTLVYPVLDVVLLGVAGGV